MSKKYCLTLDLKDDRKLIEEYEEHHRKVWPEVIASIKNSGITSMEIYRLQTRLVMIMEVTDDFSFENKQQLDKENKKVNEWEALMWKYQQPLANSASGEKWQLMTNIFKLSDY